MGLRIVGIGTNNPKQTLAQSELAALAAEEADVEPSEFITI